MRLSVAVAGIGLTLWSARGMAEPEVLDDVPSVPATAEGRIERFTLDADGHLDGLLLDEGTEVHLPLPLAAKLRVLARRYQRVRVRGYRTNEAGFVLARQVTALADGRTLVDSGEPLPNAREVPEGALIGTASGVVKRLLHGPKGDVDGALLESGVIIRFPETVVSQTPYTFTVGQQIAVRGQEFDTQYGQLMRIEALGPSESQLSPVR